MENKIPTAEEFLNTQDSYIKNLSVLPLGIGEIIKQNMIEFAKLHVEAALKEASEKATLLEDGEHTYSTRYIVEEGNHYNETEIDVDPDSILNSYPLTNIK